MSSGQGISIFYIHGDPSHFPRALAIWKVLFRNVKKHIGDLSPSGVERHTETTVMREEACAHQA
jgi:hypothetical protein